MSRDIATALPPIPPVRPEYEVALTPLDPALVAAAAPTPWQAPPWLRKALVLVVLVAVWEIAARVIGDDLMLPSALQTARAFYDGLLSGELLRRVGASLRVLAQGYALGVLLAFVLTALTASTRWGRDVLGTLTAMFNPLPAIALLPLALLWFGLGTGSLVFVLVHSVLWPLALTTCAGFQAVPETLRMAGRNYGLRGPRYVAQLLIPAALPAILSGLKIGWAFAWRTLIAAELVFGATSGQGGGVGTFSKNRNELYTDKVFAVLAMVIVLGVLVEGVVFQAIERLTVRRWGMQR
ncbi:ABC transporter permease subunit [Xanthomonas oryzae pv. oryzae]|nr:ABC transporter permease subunit [Xanthomonas oryzae pv. oryzae]